MNKCIKTVKQILKKCKKSDNIPTRRYIMIFKRKAIERLEEWKRNDAEDECKRKSGEVEDWKYKKRM